ncbi:Nif11-like leader peptide family natural product precursor [Anabaena sp. 4-3]|uniref:Nif11-like leader peptide family natural product precursor n=1 Tax=Anabaena sp. 4-3 TaxID=1811979 RepID=UPI00082C1285|nr:Nif11-like leader peptide family natural product precursor [Anabaena sp. 4-3]
MSLAHVKSFYERLNNDEAFRAQIQNVKNKEECSQIVKAHGYYFTQEEFEEYTIEVLESANAEDELRAISDQELAAVVGGRAAQPLYGVIIPPYRL